MGRLIKCQAKNCRNGGKVDTDEAFVYYHYTKKGNLQKKKYCNRNEFHEEYLENMWYNRSRRRVDRILGYVCVSNQKNTMLANLYKAGYKRKDVFDCLVHYQDEIIKYMEFKNIDNEYQKLRYVFAVIENNIKDFSKVNNSKKKIRKSIPEVEKYEEVKNDYEVKTINKTKRKSLKDRLGVK